jgi:dienelactone hydrolase
MHRYMDDSRVLHRFVFWAAALSTPLLTSCAIEPCSRVYTGPRPRPAEVLNTYGTPPHPTSTSVALLKQKKHYLLERVELDSNTPLFGQERIKVDYYRTRRPGRSPAVLALPITGGVDFSVESFARVFASHGFHVAIVYNRGRRFEKARTAEEVEEYFRQIVLDNRLVLDWMVRQPEVDPNRLGCLGISLGGIKAALVAGADPRIRAAALCLAGGSLADIAVASKERSLRKCIDQWVASGVPRRAIHEELSTKVVTDPLRLAPYIDARSTLMFIAVLDQSVPRSCGERLRRAIGGPETVYLPTGHYTGFLYLPYAHAKTLAFFKKQLVGVTIDY